MVNTDREWQTYRQTQREKLKREREKRRGEVERMGGTEIEKS